MDEISIGSELKDSFKSTDKWIKQGVDWMTDLEGFYRQRASIEKEYAEKLNLLSAEAFKKKAKISSLLSVGEDPTITPGSLESASLVAWTEVLTQTELIAKEHSNLASDFEKRIAGGFMEMHTKYDTMRSRWKAFNEELVQIRDKHYDELAKSKKDYDTACQAMENQRAKSEKSSNERSQHKYEKRQYEMNVAKNNYLIKINIANRLKDKYFYQDLPEVLDGLQDLNEARVSKVNSFLLTASALEKRTCESIIKKDAAMDEVIKQNLPKLDTAMFIKHNMNDWKEPDDFYYIPSSIWHDDETMITDSRELDDLRQRLNSSNSTYEKYENICTNEKQKLGELMEQRKQVMGDTFSDVKMKTREEYFKFEELLGKTLTALQQFSNDDTRRVIAEVELETIQSSAGDKDLTLSRPIEKKKKSALGFLKRSRHSKETSTVQEGEEDDDDVLSLTSGMSRFTTHTHHSGSTKSRLFGSVGRAVSVSSHKTSGSVSGPQAKALYAYAATGDDEVSVSPGEIVQVSEADDGSGWTTVITSNGEEGTVPTSYLQLEAATNGGGKKQGPKVAPRRGAKKVKYMEILYDYEPQGDDELGVGVGDKILVVTEDDGSGWTEGEIEGIRGLFPTSYGKMI
ncbi:hypothetical protein CANARDRAFT_9236 [[Candida] arabinofermentans NRRL YB-2248]|uniref:Protein BZZ1 n=1 Tax=[Candida] arabinofermentans NRRL YB-2248 TaxID=983967 RepID=A0A1E4SWS3_9ASCO|nr:hypothetical protein CANARDRAFT_9236 [[Candida] arabinofermentans NRRL YB-2248]